MSASLYIKTIYKKIYREKGEEAADLYGNNWSGLIKLYKNLNRFEEAITLFAKKSLLSIKIYTEKIAERWLIYIMITPV
ncbi:MAG: TPR-REGION domain-containing protein [Candidatus Midichloria mitochondrii]|uniref:Uncharacterized protein n=1 Tax=Midichloria mitochondrii (strain IricVA) TaxID=696127 RepID=F7XWP8_MIDMI|nr:hypothetical protein [Candidatus Midichloria mitochondrii]AEI89097.1 hypothetical protein midi_00807 [Candidatus Midichloria mitochondrii IricVA]MDJ1256596.1 hypothetical protein [Candidatus Midichloria mitochondrii]MDJ1288316.1 hypothetical protein [Candidatus Midichloria mitochondrii]MDJ1299174.1 hypothetical protein [Candidatus Midichloria mitochondrii]MDJ1313303.1 hypothetical protein [Candidatus Midichloria mitochondrii]